MKLFYFFILAIIFSSCSIPGNKENKESALSSLLYIDSIDAKIEKSFQSKGINGCFILYDVENDTSIIYNQPRSVQQFLPASTYKIPNSLIALECGVIKDENEMLQWDSVTRFVPMWNKDHSMRTGIKYSVVWFYQELARRIGEKRMQSWVEQIRYGNMDIGNEIDNFWLVGNLRITPMEQLQFLKRFSSGNLPFNDDHIKTVQEILIEDQNDKYIFRAKSGWADVEQPIGWY